MSDGVIGLDPGAARRLAAAMRVARDAWRRDAEDLGTFGATAHLVSELRPAIDALSDAAGDCDLAAVDLDVRADLIEALDRGDGMSAARLSVVASGAITDWEAAVSGGVDERPVTVTVTTGEDFVARFAPTDPQVVGPGVACFAGGYRVRGELVGPDGRAYDLSTPELDHAVDGERRATNADWGPTGDGIDVWSLDGADPGWVTVGREQGFGQPEPEAGTFDFFLAGPSGRAYAVSSGYTPASLEAHRDITLDEYGVPTHVEGQRGGTLRLIDDVDEAGAQTPVLTTGPGGQLRYEMTAPTRGAAMVGVAQLVAVSAEAGLTARHVREQGNYAYTVEYQEHPDGRRRAIPVVYHLALDGDDEPVATMGYLAPDAEGELRATLIEPRVHGGYQPPITINPES